MTMNLSAQCDGNYRNEFSLTWAANPWTNAAQVSVLSNSAFGSGNSIDQVRGGTDNAAGAYLDVHFVSTNPSLVYNGFPSPGITIEMVPNPSTPPFTSLVTLPTTGSAFSGTLVTNAITLSDASGNPVIVLDPAHPNTSASVLTEGMADTRYLTQTAASAYLTQGMADTRYLSQGQPLSAALQTGTQNVGGTNWSVTGTNGRFVANQLSMSGVSGGDVLDFSWGGNNAHTGVPCISANNYISIDSNEGGSGFVSINDNGGDLIWLNSNAGRTIIGSQSHVADDKASKLQVYGPTLLSGNLQIAGISTMSGPVLTGTQNVGGTNWSVTGTSGAASFDHGAIATDGSGNLSASGTLTAAKLIVSHIDGQGDMTMGEFTTGQ